ncbi:MAG TPA: FAD-binding oxidoreductase [Candidatus Dormibacteraeota bacterium]
MQITRRPVRDLWPLGVMRERAGAPPPEVLVVRPETYDQVAELLRWASSEKVTIVPVGAATGVCGGATPDQGEVALDLTGFDRVLEIDEHNLTCHVQAGVLGLRLEEQLLERGLTLGHYPSSLPVSSVGGLVVTRSSGQESSRHGSIEDMLLGLTVALPDGTIAHPRPGPRSAVGPALHELFVGSEGALGVVLDVVLRVHRKPAAVMGGGWLFPDLRAGLEAAREIIQRDLRPLVLRLYDADDTAFQGVAQPGCLLVCAAAGEPAVAVAEAEVIAGICAAATDLGPTAFEHWRDHRFGLSAERMLQFLEPAGSFVDTIEVAAPWTAIEQVHAEVKAALQAAADLALCHFSHAYGQGVCAYFTFGGSAPSEAEAEKRYQQAWDGAMEVCVRLGATISHHHGVGRVRARWARGELDGWWGVWQKLRDALDPASVMNPRAGGGR